jgi:hypothetical protein
MFLAIRHLQALVFALASVGMLVPAWATQPCKCGEGDGCCSKRVATCCSEKPCCAARAEKSVTPSKCETLPTCESLQLPGCPCCTKAPAPTTPAQKQSEVVHQSPTDVVIAPATAIIPPVIASSYLASVDLAPTAHPPLRLHALYRVWLN